MTNINAGLLAGNEDREHARQCFVGLKGRVFHGTLFCESLLVINTWADMALQGQANKESTHM